MKLKTIYMAFFAAAFSAASAFEIKTAQTPSIYEQNAAALLYRYASKIDKNSKTVFVIKQDDKMPDQSWRVEGDGQTVTLSGNRSGLYGAVAHYLQDVADLMIYSPFELEALKKELPAKFDNISGKPAFAVRDFHSVYVADQGEYEAMRSINGDSAVGTRKAYLNKVFGPPYFVHTFAYYISPRKYFKSHPEWFSEINGKRINSAGSGMIGAQLCLSNKEMRKEVLVNLRKYIKSSNDSAKKYRYEAPVIFDISQNDNQRYCRCKNCDALAAKYGNSQAGLLLDFINEIAREIRKEYPGIFISSAFYQYTEAVPTNIKPESNVIVILTDTASNVLKPLDSDENKYFRDLLKKWSKLSDNIRIWDYNITFQSPREMPYNSEWTYQSDMRFFRDNGVKQVFTEFEEPVISDARDYKIYLKTTLQENPDLDVAALAKKFAVNYYGKAAELFLQYRELLKNSQQKHGTALGMYPPVNSFNHLNLETLIAAHKIFDQGRELLKDDPVRLKRWETTALSLDRATLILSRNLMQEYFKKHGDITGYPFDRKMIAERILKIAERENYRNLAANRQKFLKSIKAEIAKYSVEINPKSLITPEIFKNVPAQNLFDFTMENSSRWRNFFKLIDDPESSVGKVARVTFPHENPAIKLEDYKFPFLFGIHSPSRQKTFWGHNLQKHNVKKAGYNWYKLGTTTLTSDCYMFIHKSWNIKLGIANAFDPNAPEAKYDVWVSMKFSGPAYPFGKADEANSVSIERVMLIKK